MKNLSRVKKDEKGYYIVVMLKPVLIEIIGKNISKN